MTRVPTTSPTRLLLRAASGGVWWSVVAANGRVLGRSSGPLGDARLARVDFLGLCPLLPDLPVTFGRERREWTWRVGDAESGHIAMSGQGYERHATARSAYARFVVAAEALCVAAATAGPVRPGQR